MNLDAIALLQLVFIVFVSAIAQSTVGFGYALFSAPLLLLIGIPLPNIIVLIGSCSLFQSILGTWKMREFVPWKLTLTSSIIRIASLLLGVFLLKQLVLFSNQHIRCVIGLVICLIVISQFFFKAQPKAKVHWGWASLAFIGSGVMAGVVGMGGPALVLWSMSQNWDAKKIRAFLFSAFATSIPVQILIFYLSFGSEILRSAVLAMILIPVIWLGTYIGLPLGNKMDKDKLKLIAYSILLILGLSSIIPVFF